MKTIKQFCYVDTLYSLLLYLLVSNINLDETFYFWGENIPEQIRRCFKGCYLPKRKRNKNKFMDYIEMYKYYKNIKNILEVNNFFNKKIYLQDHLESSFYFLDKIEECFLIEDGLKNYDEVNLLKINNMNEKIKYNEIFKEKILKGINKKYKILGLSEKIKKIYLTGITEIPELIKDKVEIINLKEKWEKLSFEEKEEILRIFDLKNSDLIKWQKLENRILLITQPLSEDGIISEKEKIEIYKEIVGKK